MDGRIAGIVDGVGWFGADKCILAVMDIGSCVKE